MPLALSSPNFYENPGVSSLVSVAAKLPSTSVRVYHLVLGTICGIHGGSKNSQKLGRRILLTHIRLESTDVIVLAKRSVLPSSYSREEEHGVLITLC